MNNDRHDELIYFLISKFDPVFTAYAKALVEKADHLYFLSIETDDDDEINKCLREYDKAYEEMRIVFEKKLREIACPELFELMNLRGWHEDESDRLVLVMQLLMDCVN